MPSQVWGDLLLTFGEAPERVPGRGGELAWRQSFSRGSGSLRSQGPRSGWCGYPVTAVSEGPWRLWMFGEAYGASGLRDALPALEVASGRRPASELNGHLLLLGWNESERRWHAWTDRFGTVHAYYANDGSRACVGTFFAAVAEAASRRRLDWEGIAGFFGFGFFPEDRTFFEDVRILRPASHYVFDEDGKLDAVEHHWRWRHRPEKGRSYEETVEEFAHVLHRVLGEQSAGRLAVPISGGLDSRTTVAALTRQGRVSDDGMWSYSYGYTAESVETRIAGRVAAARSLPFRALTVGPYLFDRLGQVLSCVEGFQDLTQSRQAVVSDLLAAEADAVMAAHWGDVWLDDMGLTGSDARSETAVTDHALSKITKRGGGWLLDKVAGPRLRQAAGSRLREFVAGELGRVEGIEDPDFRVKAFKTEQWSFRWTLASIRMFQAGTFPRLPFYDTRLSDLFATVPSAFVAGRRLQIDYLKRFAPDLARIKWQAYDTNLFQLPYFRTWLLPVRAAKKAMRLLARHETPERNWEVQFLGERGRSELERHLLSPGSKLLDLVAPGDVRSLLDSFFAAPLDGGCGYTVSMLLTFAAWLEAHA